MISAIDIQQLWYADALNKATDTALTPQKLYDIVKASGTGTEIKNVHQDTWTIDESEPSQDSYRNQLTGSVYRMSRKTMGDVTFSFTVGQYDYATKAALMGGEVLNDGKGWARSRKAVETHKMLIALTYDGVYCVLPKANIVAREANTDGAVGIAVVGTMMEPDAEAVASEYWFDKDEVKGA